jgi:hypothetical protein
MKKIVITIMGQKIEIEYQVHSDTHIEWCLCTTDAQNGCNTQLLDMLLKIHYTPYIESIIREFAHYHSYSERVGAFPDDYKPF